MKQKSGMSPVNQMKRWLLLLFSFTVPLHCIHSREIITLQTGWKFANGHHELAYRADFDDSRWQDITLPHDWAIAGPFIPDGDGSTGKLPWKGEGWYRNRLSIDAGNAGKTIYLVFDGVMAFPEVYVNGELAGKWDYGYNSFCLDITPLIKAGVENLIAVHADTRQHDSRWYPGAGIYRKVQMVITDPVHAGIWGTCVTTPIVRPGYADVRILSRICNASGTAEKEITVEQLIISPEGKTIASHKSVIAVDAGKSTLAETRIGLTNPRRWDIDHPVLYQLKTVLYRNNTITDSICTDFGIRTMRFTPDNGFYLNDRRIQLRGVNLHHDQGPLGAAFYPRAMERQLEIMKSMGCNALRTSHNVPAPELLELCDKMGILVFDEIFDKYDKKADITEKTDFDEFAHRNVRNFVERDRNHPCIFIWSVGNEIYDVQNDLDNGFYKLHTMVNYVRKYDPTRPVTMVCDDPSSASLRHFDYYDVHSWNYGHRYDPARQIEPEKAVIISESASTVSTRGFYELPLPEKRTGFTRSLQVSSYDMNAPAWADLPDEDFMWQQEDRYVAGEFVWTGFDYLGEPTPYDNLWVKEHGMKEKDASRSSYFGIVDLCGIPKDRYYLYKSYWKPGETTVHILPHWNGPGNDYKKVPVFVYTGGDCAELFVNGKSLGMKCKAPSSKNAVDRFRLIWPDVDYEPGELRAVAYKEGIVIGEDRVRTAGAPYEIRLTPDRETITADGMDLSYVLIEGYDKDGNPCPLADNRIDITVSGPGRIAGVGNGNPQSFESFQSDHVRLFNGKAMLILGSTFEAGTVEILATSEGLVSVPVTVTTVTADKK